MPDRVCPTYPPLNQLKPVGRNIWIVDGPEITFPLPWMPWVKMRFPTRMTVIRLAGDQLLLHSPTSLVPELKTQLRELGSVRWLVAPNRIHYWWIPDWQRAYPQAQTYLAPRVREQAGDRLDFDTRELHDTSGYPWDAEVATLPVRGSFMTEVEFFHYGSRTLVLTDLIENFEPHKVPGMLMRLFVRLGGVSDPNGQMPRDMRATFLRPAGALRRAVETMIEWQPERIVIAHGRWYPSGGTTELRRAFRWLLDEQ